MKCKMKKRQQPAHPQYGGLEYFDFVASVERCVRFDIGREKLRAFNPEQIMDWLHSMSESGQILRANRADFPDRAA